MTGNVNETVMFEEECEITKSHVLNIRRMESVGRCWCSNLFFHH